VLAAKAALAVRVDALSDEPDTLIGHSAFKTVEKRIAELEGNKTMLATNGGANQPTAFVAPTIQGGGVNTASDMVDVAAEQKKEKKAKKDKKKRKAEETETAEAAAEEPKSAKKSKKEKKEKKAKA
jgi:hypothetical protein